MSKQTKEKLNSEYPLLSFKTQNEWRKWLLKNYSTENGIWLRIFKKESEVKSITYGQALEEALCFGWIDGQAKSYDEKSYIQKFTPRRKRSIWSKKNTLNAERLIKEGRMHSAGLAEIERAKSDGRWENAYHSSAEMQFPDEFIKLLSKDKNAQTFFNKLDKANLYAIAWRLQTARKPETREKRMKTIIEMLKAGDKFH